MGSLQEPQPLPDSGRKVGEAAEPRSNQLLTIPNFLSAIRLVGSFVLIALAIAEEPLTVLVLFIALEMTDWFDGRLAIALNQRTVFGARLDSVADVCLAGATLFAGLWLHWAALQPEFIFMATAIGLYGVSSIYGLRKFGSIPTYHTFGAKKCWGLITIGVVCIFGGWATWPFRVAMIAVTLTNLEAILITRVLQQPQVDVTSLYHVLRERRRPSA
ncbi:MAG: CDP-alcohol phosphatidyltransferase family protein [Rhodopirellula sp.]|nr:CDP-alcohol phosphatidyltransferase family protein [Rhodopirellula sp.]